MLTGTMTDAPPQEVKAATLTAIPREVFDGGEIVILAVKPAMWRPILESLPWLVTCVVTASALIWFGMSLSGLSSTASAQVILLVAVARLSLAVVHWIPTWYVLTNRRVITIRGIRKPKVFACPLIDLQEVYPCVANLEKTLGIGSIQFVTDDPKRKPFFWISVTQHLDVHTEIVRAINNARHDN